LNQDKKHREEGSHHGRDPDNSCNREFAGKLPADEGFCRRVGQDTRVGSLFRKRPAGFKCLESSLGTEYNVGFSRVGKRDIAGTVAPEPA
jgi:hypothetical protein